MSDTYGAELPSYGVPGSYAQPLAPRQPPGFAAMMGDTLGPLGMLGVGRSLYGAGKLAATKIPSLLARYGASAGGSLAASPITGIAAGLTGLTPFESPLLGARDGSFQANKGEQDMYVKDPATGQWVPNPANPLAKSQALLKQSMSPATAATPPTPTPTVAAPMQAAMASQAAAPVPMPAPAPMPNPTAPPAAPMSLAPPGAGTTPPPANLYNGPGSMSYGQGGAPGATPATGGIPNGANITSVLQKLFNGNASAIGQPQAPQAAQSNPMGNILPFIKNLFSGSSSGSDSSNPGNIGSLY